MSIRAIGGIYLPHKLVFRAVRGTRLLYLHKGPRVHGLKRDPQEVFTTFTNHKYGQDADNLAPVKQFLTEKYQIPDDLALQVLTHKSFGNGIKPYNEKLSAMGLKLLNLYCAKYTTDTPATTNDNAINGKNVDVLGSPMAKELTGRLALGLFAKSHKLNEVLFWKSYNHSLSFEASGEMKVSAQMMYALIGAVTFIHGKHAAEQFILEKLIKASPSLEEISATVVENVNREHEQ